MISVIVPVHNGEKLIGACLRALSEQTVAHDAYELIVVDDGSTDQTGSVVGQYRALLVRQEQQGPAAARNAGAAVARGEILLFTDADCVPDPDWIEQMSAPFRDPEISGVRGRYRCDQTEPTARFAQLEYEHKYERLKKKPFVDFIDTSSAGYRRDVFKQQGGFPVLFETASGEDTDLSYRLAEKGFRLVFNPRAVVAHRHPAALGEYLRRKYKTAVWRVFLYDRHPGKMIRDSHTPQVLKLQIGLFYIVTGCLVLLPAGRGFGLGLAAAAAAFLVSTVPFAAFAARKNPLVAAWSPVLMFLRSAVFGVGLAAGAGKLAAARLRGRKRKA